MRILFYSTLLCLWMTKDNVCCMDIKVPFEFRTVTLGESFALKCHYNCSHGFVRGCWSKLSHKSVCLGEINHKFCSVTLHLPAVSSEDLKYNYTCYTQATDDPLLRQKTHRVVSLLVKDQTSTHTWIVAPSNTPAPVQPRNSTGAHTEIPILATFSLAVVMAMMALVVYLYVNHNQCSRSGDDDDDDDDDTNSAGSPVHSRVVFSPINGSSQNEQMTLRVSTPDIESQGEVPYAEIMISVRGVSTPELTKISYLATDDSQQWRVCESRAYMQASRSADRLHLPQTREVRRKMRTNSDYAVITYA